MAPLSRRELGKLALAGAAVAILPACSHYDGQVSAANGQAVLTFAQFSSLAGVGGSAVVDVRGGFPIVVVRTGATTAAALSATCTHQGCIMAYEASINDVHCNCHNADFTLDGAVVRGPTSIPLPTYPATVGSDAITVQIG